MYRPPRPLANDGSDKENRLPLKECSQSKQFLAASNPQKVFADPIATLCQPFEVPYKQSNGNARRSTRKRVDYTAFFSEDGENKKRVLIPIIDPKQELFSPFRFPSSKFQPSEHVGCLGMTRVPEWKPQPLHDPQADFAIVLFDPSVDKLPDLDAAAVPNPNQVSSSGASMAIDTSKSENSKAQDISILKKELKSSSESNLKTKVEPRTRTKTKKQTKKTHFVNNSVDGEDFLASRSTDDANINETFECDSNDENEDGDYVEMQDKKLKVGNLEDEYKDCESEEEFMQDETKVEETLDLKVDSSRPKKAAIKTDSFDLGEFLGVNIKPDTKTKLVPVVIDPKLAKVLRPHQIEGAKFLYRCTMGLADPRVTGCIMADEMGLGKTLQCITLLWTLLKQSPAPTTNKRGSIEKAVVVCPSSLVLNWANEFAKWLGPGAVNCLAIDGKNIKGPQIAAKLKLWAQADGRRVMYPVLVISYDTLRRNADVLGEAEIGLMLADEGHKLKNADSLTFESLTKLNAKRRVILSGTPIQNDLSEYFALLDFANPGFLGTRADFRKNYENKIIKMGYLGSTDKECEEGNAKLAEMLQNVSRFIIRRTNDLLSEYLPIKYEHVVFCGLTEFQRKLYCHYLSSKEVNNLLKGKGTQTLQGINILKKLCNHPDLLDLTNDIAGVENLLPEDYVPPAQRMVGRNRNGAVRPWYSGKFMVLARMLTRIRQDTDDKIVLISNYTQTLDLIETMCRENRFGTMRLDGAMAINKRQKLVDRFNDPNQPEFVFLLSSKAGGCGINLIGANRLILLDPDWNPASDQQALARVWRDGQKKTCFIYRFIATGTIEEKILQRQSMKMSLSSQVVDEKTNVEKLFSSDMLKALFKYNEKTQCDTHDTFNCKRCSSEKQLSESKAMLYGDATTWNHYPASQLNQVEDKLLKQESDGGVIDFVFQYKSI